MHYLSSGMSAFTLDSFDIAILPFNLCMLISWIMTSVLLLAWLIVAVDCLAKVTTLNLIYFLIRWYLVIYQLLCLLFFILISFIYFLIWIFPFILRFWSINCFLYQNLILVHPHHMDLQLYFISVLKIASELSALIYSIFLHLGVAILGWGFCLILDFPYHYYCFS